MSPDEEALLRHIAGELSLPLAQVQAVVKLLDEGNTLPFIARYRKEATQGCDEVSLRAIEDALERARDIAQRKQTILKTIAEQGALTDELRRRIEACMDRQELEDLYLPYKPKRKTRGALARQRGLQGLADVLLSQEQTRHSRVELLKPYVSPAKDVPDEAAALQGACDIIAEQWSEDADVRGWLAEQAMGFGSLCSQAKRGKKDEASEKFEAYLDHRESVKRIPSHRLLAMLRGESEGLLRVELAMDDEFNLRKLRQRFISNGACDFHQELWATVEDCYQRLLLPAAQSATLKRLKEQADEEAIAVFARNLRDLLLAAPAGHQVTIGIDPGFRTGCKLAVVDGNGKYLESTAIFPTPPRNDVQGAGRVLKALIEKHDVRLIAIGNGTASRETDSFVNALLKAEKLDVAKVVVSEAGASIYSASELAVQEYPDLDVTVRGAISIAHRLQDPLAELVKIEPKSIGVGQYQHDVNQPLLRKCLDREVESCVNLVGVDVNLASGELLSHVAGIGPKLSRKIVEYRDHCGGFRRRDQLLKVPTLGRKAYEQAAGFLRIRDGDEPLDNSSVHPESYYVVQKMAECMRVKPQQLVGNAALAGKLDPQQFVDEKVGLPTVQDIVQELSKPGRDPRSEFRVARFSEDVHELKDLREGMVLEGVVTNVTRFGAFCDVGVHHDGLIHISQLADGFVQDPSDVVSVGDVVKVKVLEVDVNRKRISLTRKF